MKTNATVKTNVIEINADGETLGRLAVRVATILRGKDLASFTPNQSPNLRVVVFNTDRLYVSGQKRTKTIAYRHTGYPGGIIAESLGRRLEKDSREVLRSAVYGMLPKNRLRDRMITRLDLIKTEKGQK